MTQVIAVAGKGGVGKSTFTSMLISSLIRNKISPVLAVDADPNSSLGEILDIPVDRTLGGMRQEFFDKRGEVPAGMAKETYLNMVLQGTVIEEDDIDLLVMGRQEGAGCYCFVNNVVRRYTEELAQNYPFVVIDNEAGMEHLSRHSTHKLTHLLLVTDHSISGSRAAVRINQLANDLKLDVKNRGLILNRAPEVVIPEFMKEIEPSGLPILAKVPLDENIKSNEFKKESIASIPTDSPAVAAVEAFVKNVLLAD